VLEELNAAEAGPGAAHFFFVTRRFRVALRQGLIQVQAVQEGLPQRLHDAAPVSRLEGLDSRLDVSHESTALMKRRGKPRGLFAVLIHRGLPRSRHPRRRR
jgi:hypothetical protein